ncbi:ATP-binding protein [Actinomyces minihominis]|uniref:ATP-binding protein n=1 Tax=Actinomyces minihominis TaxID=2002838 RepID=UPI003522E6BB
MQDGSLAVLRVANDGPSISPELQERVFDRFVRSDLARSTLQGSTGLGLSIVRSVARTHGGDASVGTEGSWTIFELTLPLSRKGGSTT